MITLCLGPSIKGTPSEKSQAWAWCIMMDLAYILPMIC